MQYLIKLGISKSTLDFLKTNCTKEEIISITNCMSRLESSILYLRELGVNNEIIEQIIMIDYHVLMPGRKHLEIALSKLQDINQFVSSINEHVEYMDYLRNIS